MKFIAITTSLIVVFLFTHYIDSSSIPKIDDQKNIVSNDIKELIPLPNFNFTNLEGKTLSIDDFKGKVIILNFWAVGVDLASKNFQKRPRLSVIIRTPFLWQFQMMKKEKILINF